MRENEEAGRKILDDDGSYWNRLRGIKEETEGNQKSSINDYLLF